MERHGHSHADLARIMGRDKAEITKTIALTRVSAEVRDRYNAAPKKVARDKLYQIAGVEESAGQMRLWQAFAAEQPGSEAPAARPGGDTPADARRLASDAPEVLAQRLQPARLADHPEDPGGVACPPGEAKAPGRHGPRCPAHHARHDRRHPRR